LKRPQEEIEQQINSLAKNIIAIYDESLLYNFEVDYIRRCKFLNHLKILKYYRDLEIYCKLNKKRKKGATIKSDVVKIIIQTNSQQNLNSNIKGSNISLMIRRAIRVERLLKLSNHDLNIVYAFPDLDITFFSSNCMNIVNYERWLKLVETNYLVSIEDGRILYNEYKEKTKRERLELLKSIYINADMQIPEDIEDEIDEDVEEE
jgi:hypothetical protein